MVRILSPGVIRAGIVLAALAAPEAAPAASFACAQARTGTERLICADAALGARDEILARIYAAALRKDVDGRIRAAQRQWHGQAEACGSAACLAQAYDGRIGALLTTEGGREAATHAFSEVPEGNHGTLSAVGPVHGFAYVTLIATFVGPSGVGAGDIAVAEAEAFLDLRRGMAETPVRGCILGVRPYGSGGWTVTQRGRCDLPRGTVFAGRYRP